MDWQMDRHKDRQMIYTQMISKTFPVLHRRISLLCFLHNFTKLLSEFSMWPHLVQVPARPHLPHQVFILFSWSHCLSSRSSPSLIPYSIQVSAQTSTSLTSWAQSTLPPPFIFLSWTYCYFTEYTFVFNMSSTSGKPVFVKVNDLLSMTQILTSAPWVSTSVCTFSSCASSHFSYFDPH